MVLLHPPQFRSRRQVATSGGEFRNFTVLELIDSTSCECLARCAELGDMNSCESLAVALARRHDVLDELDEADVHDGLDITITRAIAPSGIWRRVA